MIFNIMDAVGNSSASIRLRGYIKIVVQERLYTATAMYLLSL